MFNVPLNQASNAEDATLENHSTGTKTLNTQIKLRVTPRWEVFPEAAVACKENTRRYLNHRFLDLSMPVFNDNEREAVIQQPQSSRQGMTS